MTTRPIRNYPDNGKHLECFIDLPFEIRKGEDGYHYQDKKGNTHEYNLGKKITKKWIINLEDGANASLRKIFEIRTSKDLGKLINYATKLYLKSLKMERKRVKDEIINQQPKQKK